MDTIIAGEKQTSHLELISLCYKLAIMPDQAVPPPRGDSQRADKYISQLLPLISGSKVPISHTDLSQFDPSSLQDHYRVDIKNYQIEISHSKSPTTGIDSYVMLFTKITNLPQGLAQKEIMAYLTLSDDQFKRFKAVADEQIETKKRLEEEKRFSKAMTPVEELLQQATNGSLKLEDPPRAAETQNSSGTIAQENNIFPQLTQDPPPPASTPPSQPVAPITPDPSPIVETTPTPPESTTPTPTSTRPTNITSSKTPTFTSFAQVPHQLPPNFGEEPKKEESQVEVSSQPNITQVNDQLAPNAIPSPDQSPTLASQVPVEQQIVHENFAPVDGPNNSSSFEKPDISEPIDSKLDSAFHPAENAQLSHDTKTPVVPAEATS